MTNFCVFVKRKDMLLIRILMVNININPYKNINTYKNIKGTLMQI